MCAAAGIYDCGRTVVNEEGVRALWKGLTPFATHLTLKYALRMGSNSVYQVREVLTGQDSSRSSTAAGENTVTHLQQ